MKIKKIITMALMVSAVIFLSSCTNKKTDNKKIGGNKNTQKNIIYSYTINIANKPKVGTYLVGPNGMTLYSLAKERDNHIICKGKTCLKIWTIFYSKKISLPKELNAKDVKAFKRPDGFMQISYDNHPLYYFTGSKKFNLTGDKKPGDTFGNNIKGPEGIWHIIKFKKGKSISW